MAQGLVKYTKKAKIVRSRRMNAPRRLARFRQMKNRMNTYNFKRTWYAENYFNVSANATTSNPSSNGFAFTLNNLPDASDFQNLFDSYRINKIVVKIIPKVSEYTGLPNAGVNNAMLPTIHSVVDYDDSTAPTSISQLAQYDTYRSTRGIREHTRVFVPKVELQGGTSIALPKSYQWIDTDNIDVPHRGLKIWITGPAIGTNTSQYFDLKVTVYASFKHVI